MVKILALKIDRNQIIRLRVQVLVLLSTVLLVMYLDQQGWLTRIENAVFDDRISSVRSETILPSSVKVVLIDESSLAKMAPTLGQFPWPRTVYAELIEFFEMGGAKAVLFDILFTEPEKHSLGQGAVISEHDARLADATELFPHAVHAALLKKDSADDRAQTIDQALPALFIDKFQLLNVSASINDDVNSYTLPIDPLIESSSHIGIVGVDPDDDGIYRRVKLLWEYQQGYYPAFSLVPLLLDQPSEIVSEPHLLTVNEDEILTDSEGRLLINFYGDYQPYPIAHIFQSFDQIQMGDFDALPVDPFEFENTVVFIGASAIGLEDTKAMPNNPKAPGVYLHASAYANMLMGEELQVMPLTVTYSSIVVAALLAIVFAFHIPLFSIKITLLMTAPILWWWITGIQLENNVVINVALPTLSLGLAWTSSFTYLSFTEGASKRRVKRMLSQYVSETMLNEALAQSDDILHAGVGREENLSILFSDVRGFTKISESLPAEQVVQLLNCHFSEMSEVIFANQGTLDKFIGDAIMAFWGAPIQVSNHAELSVKAALDMCRQMHVVNDRLNGLKLPSITVGIGINTGQVVLGNIGSDRKLDYTVIGDAVNVASRMEGITKMYGVPVVISESTRLGLQDYRPCVLLDHVRVKGKSEPSPIYYPLPNKAESPEMFESHAEMEQLSVEAFESYQQQRWADAERLYKQLSLLQLRDVYLERIAQFRANSPPDDWDGVYTFTSK